MKNPNKNSLRERRKRARKKEEWRCRIRFLCLCVFAVSMMMCIMVVLSWYKQKKINEDLQAKKGEVQAISDERDVESQSLELEMADVLMEEEIYPPEILPEYKELYSQNEDMIGWLHIDDTIIDYPVMQTVENEDYYYHLNFYGEEDPNGCLIMDTDSVVGSGTLENNYQDGTEPSTNLIIHGHTMKSGQMFGKLRLYAESEYGLEHNIIYFDTLYERRKYELIAVFYSQVFYENEDVFKYYKFFEADTQEEFDVWYENIMKLSLYDTGVTAENGDEFITLSCCSYHVEDGRFVVVGKRVK